MTVIYNDTCPICSREVNQYRRVTDARGAEVLYAGLSDCALGVHGLTAEAAARRFHVVKEGQLIGGVPAFAVLWDEIPKLRWLAWLVRRPGINWAAALVYDHVLAPMLYAMHLRRQRQNS